MEFHCGKILKPRELACEHILHHDPVAYEAVYGVFKRGRPIVFKKEMTDPGGSIARYEADPDVGPGPCGCQKN